ncbi:hypothetical protein VKT23_000649 [Stygiomarasmius scandens]|uniref:Uncharacterized protein n=1 Tax=Marasmiellus scandens TaxID=2682957 RepID=A0ABR1K7B6_9AGAR
MVERMNMSYHSPSTSTSRSRRRASSAASSSVSSNGLPQTPVDSYDGLQVGALGDDFSIIKVNGKIPMVEAEEDEIIPKKRCTSPLPSWLGDTFSTLNKGHPLRLLLPPSRQPQDPDPLHAQNTPCHDDSDNVFAFHPPPPPSSPLLAEPPTLQPAAEVLNSDAHQYVQISAPRVPSPSLSALPFSTPGPASTIAPPSPPSSHISMLYTDFVPESALSPGLQHRILHPNRHFAEPQVSYPISQATSPSHDAQHEHPDWTVPSIHSSSFTFAAPTQLHTAILPCSNSNDTDAQGLIPDQIHPEGPQSNLDLESNISYKSDVFTTPGPAYYSSRPVHLESPTDDPSSDPPDPGFHVDLDTIDFQWAPFNRKETSERNLSLPTTKLASQCSQGILSRDDLGSLPPSSDAFSSDNSSHERRLHSSSHKSSRSGSKSNDLPIASSSDDYNFEYPLTKKPTSSSRAPQSPREIELGMKRSFMEDQADLKHSRRLEYALVSSPKLQPQSQADAHVSAPGTPNPFRFAPPPVLVPPPNLSQATDASTITDSHERDTSTRDTATQGQPRHVNSAIPVKACSTSKPQSKPAFAPAPGIYLSPIRSPPETKTPSKVCLEPPTRDCSLIKWDFQSKVLSALERLEEEKGPSLSQDTIESWSDE